MDKLEEVEELELSSNKNDETTENSEDKNVNEVTLNQDNVIEEIKEDNIIYWRDENEVHHVPKRSLEEVLIKQE